MMPLHVFGYGSLMWNPCFPHRARWAGLAEGWRRSWCVESTFYRGSPGNPGYVLGLKPGGHCVGVLFEIDAADARLVRESLDEREGREAGYAPITIRVRGSLGHVDALTYATPGLGEPSEKALEAAYLTARGCAGTNSEYVDRTARHLAGLDFDTNLTAPDMGLHPSRRPAV